MPFALKPPRTVQLSATAAAAATNLPRPTAIATPGPTGARPSAAVRLDIPAIDVHSPVVEVGWHLVKEGGSVRAVWDTVADAAGHHCGSADPGQVGNCVISAHSSLAGGAVLRRLNELAIGDVVQVCTAEEKCYEYAVTASLLLDELNATEAEKREHARYLDPTEQAVATLVTCWPEWAYTHRIVVRAELRAP